MVELSQLMLGTLVLNKDKLIEQVRSLQYSSRKKRCIGAQLIGEINGKAASEFEELPVTEELLAALGWKIKHDVEKSLTVARPSAEQFINESDAETFEVLFILADNAFEDFRRGDVITVNGAMDWMLVLDFVDLDHYFLDHYSQRMVVDFFPEEYNVKNVLS